MRDITPTHVTAATAAGALLAVALLAQLDEPVRTVGGIVGALFGLAGGLGVLAGSLVLLGVAAGCARMLWHAGGPRHRREQMRVSDVHRYREVAR